MSVCRCRGIICSVSSRARAQAEGAPGLVTRGPSLISRSGWALPCVILALLPKCPACLAAYIALGAGFGVSLSLAAGLRIALLLICALSLAYLVAKSLHRAFHRLRAPGRLPVSGPTLSSAYKSSRRLT